jgi:hypothetical protein
MAHVGSGVREGSSPLGQETPLVPNRAQCQNKNTECIRVSDFAVRIATTAKRQESIESPVPAFASRPDHELSHTALLIEATRNVEWGEAFVMMVMADQHYIRSGFIEILPKCVICWIATLIPEENRAWCK